MICITNRTNTVYTPAALTLREFDALFEDDEEFSALIDSLIGDEIPQAQALAPRYGPQCLSPADILNTRPTKEPPRTDVKKSAYGAAPSSITERQMRALSRKHLLLMLRDLEKELLQVTRDRKSTRLNSSH